MQYQNTKYIILQSKKDSPRSGSSAGPRAWLPLAPALGCQCLEGKSALIKGKTPLNGENDTKEDLCSYVF